jgi:hypothetical protein
MHLVKHPVGSNEIMGDAHSVRFHGVTGAVAIHANVGVIVICNSSLGHCRAAGKKEEQREMKFRGQMPVLAVKGFASGLFIGNLLPIGGKGSYKRSRRVRKTGSIFISKGNWRIPLATLQDSLWCNRRNIFLFRGQGGHS